MRRGEEVDIPLQTRSRNNPEATEEDGNVEKFSPKIDVHTYTGLTTILTVNLQQLYILTRVGSDLGSIFYWLVALTSISAILVIVLLPIRYMVEKGKTSKILYYTSLVMNVLVLVLNLILQIFDQTNEKCEVLLNQPLPLVVSNGSRDNPSK